MSVYSWHKNEAQVALFSASFGEKTLAREKLASEIKANSRPLAYLKNRHLKLRLVTL